MIRIGRYTIVSVKVAKASVSDESVAYVVEANHRHGGFGRWSFVATTERVPGVILTDSEPFYRASEIDGSGAAEAYEAVREAASSGDLDAVRAALVAAGLIDGV